MLVYGFLRELGKINGFSSLSISEVLGGILLKKLAGASKNNDTIFLDQTKILLCRRARAF